MKILQNWEQFNEAKTGIVKLSDLNDNWSASFNLSPEIKKLKKEFKELGREKTIERLISMVKTIDETDYNDAVKHAYSDYNVRLPKYESAISKKYWDGAFGKISILLVALGALSETVKKSKETIKSDIEKLKERLEKLEKLD